MLSAFWKVNALKTWHFKIFQKFTLSKANALSLTSKIFWVNDAHLWLFPCRGPGYWVMRGIYRSLWDKLCTQRNAEKTAEPLPSDQENIQI